MKKADKIMIGAGVICAMCVMGFIIYSWVSDWDHSNEVILLIQNDVYKYVHSINMDISDIEDIIGDRTVVNKSEMQMIWAITNSTNITLYGFAEFKSSLFVERTDIKPEWVQTRYQNCFDKFYALKEFKLKNLKVI